MDLSSQDLSAVALLDEPTRRRLFDYVRLKGEAVGRDEAAQAAGISRSLAAFHLDRLVDGGLLDVTYRRMSGRAGRGAGRPAKLYRFGARRISVTVPQTRYELAGQVLARAFEEGQTAPAAVRREGRSRGRELGRLAPTVVEDDSLDGAAHVLADLGFEPRIDRESGEVRLDNCPFHALVEQSRDLVCAMNGALVKGVLEGAGIDGLRLEGDDDPDTCCVRLRGGRSRS
jgi:predicted ArsR family transcriptional regulator